MTDQTRKEALAEALLKVEAVSFSPEQPYTWSSGLQAPIYCDLRRTLGYPELRRRITDQFARAIRNQHPAVDVIAGTATAGIPQAALLADRLDVPMVYVRSKPKRHGKKRRIEGRMPADSRVALVEDLISTGGSALQAAEALIEAGAHVALVVAIFSYGLPLAEKNFEQVGFPVLTLTDFPTLLKVAERTGHLSKGDIGKLHSWRRDPERWSARVVETRAR